MSKKPGFTNTYTGYVPNYKQMNIAPKEMSPPQTSQFVVSRGSKQNPRERAVPQTKTVPFAEVVVDDSFPIGTGPVPNIGNNIEHTWAGVDSSVVDDVGLYEATSPNHQMIDNNDYIEIDDLNPAHRKVEASLRIQEEEDQKAYQSLNLLVDTKKLAEYSLLIFGEFYSSGTLEEIQKEVTDILYNQHPLSKQATITLDDLTVLKKVAIKFGVFISEE